MPRIISQNNIPHLLKSLQKSYDVFAPHQKEREIIFDKVSDPAKVVLEYKQTLLPPKIYFLPPEEELFKITKDHVEEPNLKKQSVIFGLNIKDLMGIMQLDQIMGKKPADTYYTKRRDMSTLVAISDKKVGVPPRGDLILEKASPQYYHVMALTTKGRKLAKLDQFEESGFQGKPPPQEAPSKLDKMLLDSELIAKAVEWSLENYPQIWKRLGKLCLGCGICTYVCPLCYCTTFEDKTSFDGSACSRCRVWAACTLPGFAKVASGFNFRSTQGVRYFDWFYHKFVRAYKEFGQAQCVACGRCQKYCPAGIDIEEVLDEIITKFKKATPARKF
jgi:sulfhydrogenase subunit beta (sulfur reductase)